MISKHENLCILDLDIQSSTYFTLLHIHAFHLFNHPWWDLAFNLNNLIQCVMTTYYGCVTDELRLTYNHAPWPRFFLNMMWIYLVEITQLSKVPFPPLKFLHETLRKHLAIPLLLFTLTYMDSHEYKAAQISTKIAFHWCKH